MQALTPPPGTRLTLLADGKTGAPRISADGSTVVWVERRGEDWAVMRHRDGVTSRISEDGYDCANVDVSGDGSVIVYSRQGAATQPNEKASFDVYQHRDGVSSPVACGPGNEYSVAVSRDGSTIAWDDDIDGHWGQWRIGKWQDGQVSQVTDGSLLSEFPFVSDSNRVYFRQTKYDSSYLAREAGPGLIEGVAYGPGDVFSPDITADERTITWSDNSDEFNDLYRQVDGQVSVDVTEEGVDHLWSHINDDGSRMVWTCFNRKGPDPHKPKVEVRYREGAKTEVVAVGDEEGMPVEADLSDDGKRLTWMWVGHASDSPTRIYLLERDGTPA